jgi:RNA polymerase sigma factor (sigma-70 family)
VSNLSRWFNDEVQPHESALRSYIRGVFPHLRDIDDLVQESYARLIKTRETGKVSHIKAFLFTTARNVALDIFRRRNVVSIVEVSDLTKVAAIADLPDAGEAASRQQELALLAEAVRGLPERCRQVLTLRLLYGAPTKEIASRLGISDKTVKAQLAKGTRRCADFFEHRGIDTRNKKATTKA